MSDVKIWKKRCLLAFILLIKIHRDYGKLLQDVKQS